MIGNALEAKTYIAEVESLMRCQRDQLTWLYVWSFIYIIKAMSNYIALSAHIYVLIWYVCWNWHVDIAGLITKIDIAESYICSWTETYIFFKCSIKYEVVT